MQTTPKKAQAAPTWEKIVGAVNAVIEARKITLTAAAEECGVKDVAQFHKWVRSKDGASHEPRASIALRIAAWVERNQSFLTTGRTGGSNITAPTTTATNNQNQVT